MHEVPRLLRGIRREITGRRDTAGEKNAPPKAGLPNLGSADYRCLRFGVPRLRGPVLAIVPRSLWRAASLAPTFSLFDFCPRGRTPDVQAERCRDADGVAVRRKCSVAEDVVLGGQREYVL